MMSDFLDDDWCAGCGGYIANARETGVSGLYFPGMNSILLCKPCYDAEDATIETTGTNNMPDLLAHYLRTLAAVS
jgi:hypothetical protein